MQFYESFRVFQESSHVFHEIFKSESKKLLKCREIMKLFQRICEVLKSFMVATRRFQECFKCISRVIQVF